MLLNHWCEVESQKSCSTPPRQCAVMRTGRCALLPAVLNIVVIVLSSCRPFLVLTCRPFLVVPQRARLPSACIGFHLSLLHACTGSSRIFHNSLGRSRLTISPLHCRRSSPRSFRLHSPRRSSRCALLPPPLLILLILPPPTDCWCWAPAPA